MNDTAGVVLSEPRTSRAAAAPSPAGLTEHVYQPVREARALWLKTDQQLSLPVDDLTRSTEEA